MDLVLGLGRSGRATAEFFNKQARPYAVYDDLTHKVPVPTPIQRIVLSPGIALSHPLVQSLVHQGSTITTDCAILCEHTPKALHVGITGTNGKSTTTALLTHTLQNLGYDAVMCGNIGIPALSLSLDHALYIFELSSYQLERSPALPLDIAVLLNLSPDHIASHGSMCHYINAKMRIFQKAQDCFIARDDAYTLKIHTENPHFFAFSQCEADACLPPHPVLKGEHNDQNRMAVFHMVQRIQSRVSPHTVASPHAIIRAMDSFQGLPHRQESCGYIGSLHCVNDSKATSAQAAAHALSQYDHILWLIGGADKGDDLTPFHPHLHKIHHAYIFGTQPERFIQFFKDYNVPYSVHCDLESAFQHATHHTPLSARTLLLAPACASFDQYENFEARGLHFQNLVNTYRHTLLSSSV